MKSNKLAVLEHGNECLSRDQLKGITGGVLVEDCCKQLTCYACWTIACYLGTISVGTSCVGGLETCQMYYSDAVFNTCECE